MGTRFSSGRFAAGPRSPSSTTALLLLALTLAAIGLAARAASAQSDAAAAAAAWIAQEYDADDSEIELFGTGVLIDALVGLAAAGVEQDTAIDMLDELAAEADGYVGTGDTLGAGQLGKVILALTIHGKDPATFVAGRDFEAELRAMMLTTGDDTGLFGENTSVYSQALAVIGLAATDDGAPAEAVAWMTAGQCPGGEFTFDLTCPGTNDADTTGMVALALAVAGETDAATAAADWILTLQNTEGGIEGFGVANANSTAVAAQAFLAVGYTSEAAAAAGFLETLQFDGTAPEADRGGLAYLATDTAANTFATVQGIWGLAVPVLTEVVAPDFSFTDSAGSVHADDIAWVAAAGITQGCTADAFCPNDGVTRAQMAAFLTRALDLPTGPNAGFDDVAGTTFENDINAIAAAGITLGCDTTSFCPNTTVTRGQMAAFLTRALDLPTGPNAGFDDVAGTTFENDINAIAAAGITLGCDTTSFCPNTTVTRGQMAAFLRRALR